MANDEQTSEIEALSSIYGDDYVPGSSATSFIVKLLPDATGASVNHVSVALHVTFPSDYPATEPVQLRVEGTKGLDDEKVKLLQKMADDGAAANLGMPAVYTVAEELRTWLQENNAKPDDGSAFEEMMRRQREKERIAAGGAVGSKLSAFSREADPSLAAARGGRVVLSASGEDEVTRKKRDGTPVTLESFLAWRAGFEAEMAAKAAADAAAAVAAAAAAGKPAPVDAAIVASRKTGRELFESDASLATSDLALAGGDGSGAGGAAAAAGGAGGDSPAVGGAGEAAGVTTYVVDAALFAGGDDDLDDLDDDDDDDEDDEDYDDDEDGDDDDDDEDDDEDYDDEDDDDDDDVGAGAAGGGPGKGKPAPAAAKGGAGAAAAGGAGAGAAGKGKPKGR